MYTLNKEMVYNAMDEMGVNEGIIDELTRRNFFRDVMSATDPDSKDIYKLYGLLGILDKDKTPKKGGVRKSANLITKVGKTPSTPTSSTIVSGARGMINVDSNKILYLIKKSGWGTSEFCEYAGLLSYNNLAVMLKRGTMKVDVICAISNVLRIGVGEFCNVQPKGVTSMEDIQKMPAKLHEKSLSTTVEAYADRLRAAMEIHGLSIEAFSNDIHIPSNLVKDTMAHNGRIPNTSAFLCKRLTGIDVTEKPVVIEPVVKEDDNKHTSFEEYCKAERERRELQSYLEEQHKQESQIHTNQLVIEEKKNQAVRNGYISIDALTQITNMLNKSPEIKDLFVTLSILPDNKRMQIIQAMNTLITALQ
jgi:hypothetical protein